MNQTELLHVQFPHLRDLVPFDTAHTATPWLADDECKHNRKLLSLMHLSEPTRRYPLS
ncbi:hypothetical protein [Cronobacter sakazakii]|uniref:hypothetical protein n=1 Tax=Cronobacter sakazakii TaxID=28141 RepID=UPI0015E2BC7C|nr:hypothetical protein [Cronobacter sakazakii]